MVAPTIYNEPRLAWTGHSGVSPEEIEGAHLRGIEIGMREHEKILKNQHVEFLRAAQSLSVDVYEKLKKALQVDLRGMRIRATGFSSFETLFIVGPDDFYSERAEQVANFLNVARQQVTNIQWGFQLMAASEKLDESAIRADGYVTKYVESV